MTVVTIENWADENGKLGEANKGNERGNEGRQTRRALSKEKAEAMSEGGESGNSSMSRSRISKPRRVTLNLSPEAERARVDRGAKLRRRAVVEATDTLTIEVSRRVTTMIANTK